ncbi:hypothetical protein CJ030_MR2G025971 [Morella rubra]|uniref:Protein kinase domain-containing protein n=1 Tax=Morella rubra TaxID=262757 RepID=A0A6A1WGE4_9ROSI|nr:hypothetical protein CJ030_MR2G025971 [Morella rubra]
MTSGLKSAEVPSFANETDRLALLDFKNQISQDPLHIMSSWNDSIHFCNWLGVTCSPSSKRVMVLNLEARKLAGSVPPSVGNLTYLTGINLRRNSFYGEIPQEMGLLRHLQHLNLSFNSFGGKLPANLSQCTELRLLHVDANKLIVRIPDQFSSLSKLTHLNLAVNNFTGTIPTWIGNFSSLCFLDLQVNNFQGSIPNELGRLSGLGFFQLYGNNLSGTIPPQIYNISSIYCFTFTQNRLHGILPSDVGLTLPNLEIFAGGVNSFTGPIPVSLSNASRLQILDFAENGLTGGVPQSLSGLPGLVRLNMDDNWLGNGKVGGFNFLSFLANCTALKVLGLARNQFGGVLPSSIANLSTQLSRLTMGGNMIHGGIPTGIGNLFNLNSLGLEFNYLGGHLPDSLGKLQNLEGLYLNVNRFSGIIPSSFGNLTRLTKLFMEENAFEGSTLPFEVGNLENLAELDLSGNRLSGDIPPSLGSCVGLETLAFGRSNSRILEDTERFRRNGPFSEQLVRADSSIPRPVSVTKYLNLSYNDLEGNVPSEGIFNNTTAISLFGNDKLCGGIPELQLTTCSRKSSGSSGKVLALRVAIPITSIIIFSIVLLYFCSSCSMMKNSRKRPLASSSSTDRQLRVSYAELLESTNSFSADNLIGSGSFGTVYKGVLPSNGAIVAIKVLNLQLHGASKSFIDECNALRSIRHRNLLKIVTACSSMIIKGMTLSA